MSLFGPPNIQKLKSNKNIDGLLKALNYKKFYEIRLLAIESLLDINDTSKNQLINVTFEIELLNELESIEVGEHRIEFLTTLI